MNNFDDEATPPWEFYYTSKVYYGAGVKRGDSTKVAGCTCRGGCKPSSSSCSCVLQQCKYYPEHRGFQYKADGTVVDPDYPVFECNANCSCGEECQNRVRRLVAECVVSLRGQVVQRGQTRAVNIIKTPDKGWGESGIPEARSMLLTVPLLHRLLSFAPRAEAEVQGALSWLEEAVAWARCSWY